MRNYKELDVWKKSHALTLIVYRATRESTFPPEEKYGVVGQIRRAVVSIEANIAEGSRKNSDADFCRFLNIAEGSAAEVEVLAMIIRDVGYLTEVTSGEILTLATEVSKMLYAFKRAVL
jgi:four helix bundle protein